VGSDGKPRCPTSFPNPVNLGAAFNDSMWLEMGSIIGRELRSLWLQGATEVGNSKAATVPTRFFFSQSSGDS
jgi:hypothetical protein